MASSDDLSMILEHMDSKFDQMAEAISALSEKVDRKVDEAREDLTAEIRLTRQAVQGNSACLNAHEERIDDLDGRVSSLEAA